MALSPDTGLRCAHCDVALPAYMLVSRRRRVCPTCRDARQRAAMDAFRQRQRAACVKVKPLPVWTPAPDLTPQEIDMRHAAALRAIKADRENPRYRLDDGTLLGSSLAAIGRYR